LIFDDAQPNQHHGCGEMEAPIIVRVLGHFELAKLGQPIYLRSGGKAEALLGYLAVRRDQLVPRDTLLGTLWPTIDLDLAADSLNSLAYRLRKLCEPDHIEIVSRQHGGYRLNRGQAVQVDVDAFDTRADAGDCHYRAGEAESATRAYQDCVSLYQGDLAVNADVYAVVERERLRVRYLGILARLADDAYQACNYVAALGYVLKLLASEPCREDAHRLAMRCYLRLGERAQALRQFQLCQQVLRAEFNAQPESASLELFEQIRLNTPIL
jgi:DNA-binding SARP family transcriptional activator